VWQLPKTLKNQAARRQFNYNAEQDVVNHVVVSSNTSIFINIDNYDKSKKRYARISSSKSKKCCSKIEIN